MAPRSLWTGENLRLSIGRQTLFDDAFVSIQEGERVALVGRNGTGKTTLLKTMAGLEKVSSGTITTAKNLRVSYMPQDFSLNTDMPVREIIRSGMTYFDELHRLYDTLPLNAPEHEQTAHALDMHDAWNIENKLDVILEKLELSGHILDTRFSDLSGGEKRRVMLGRAIGGAPELLLLDEPTNHLDIDTVAWVENFVANSACTCFLITHDRYFLDRAATRIIELDNGKTYSVEGSYADFLEAKAEREYNEDVLESKRKAFLRREIEWVRRSPKARLKKNLGREQRFYDIQAQKAPERASDVELVIPLPPRLGNKAVTLKNVDMSLGGRQLLKDFSCEITAGHKIGVVGPNGIGKTTLLRLMTGELAPEKGSVETADTVVFNYVDQSRLKLNEELTVYEEISEGHSHISLGGDSITIWAYLRRFLFADDRINSQIKYLSGGEKARLILAKILKRGGNFLILDEPTNDLDLPTLRILEEALAEFTGIVVVVSHDRYFLNRICNHIIAFERDRETPYFTVGDYDYYLKKRIERESSAEQSIQQKTSVSQKQTVSMKPQAKKKLTYAESLELESFETAIPEAEEAVAAIEKLFADPDLFSTRAKEVPQIRKQLDEAKSRLEKLYARWEELETKKGES